MTSSAHLMVREFHETYGLPIRDEVSIVSTSEAKLRERLLLEEVQEYVDAEAETDIVEIADALGDIVYIAYGTALAYGIDLDVVLAEIHRSNMSKLGQDGKPIYREDGKVLKGPNFTEPNLAKVMGLEAKQAS